MISSAHPSPKPALLLLCGLLCDAAIGQPQRAALRDLADVQVVDFAGFDSITHTATHVLAVAPPQFALAGHSMGGRVALEIMRQAPTRVLRLALLDTGIAPRRDGEREERLALVRLAHAQGMYALAQRWLPPMLHPDHTADAVLMDGLMAMVQRQSAQSCAGQSNALLERPDATPVLAQIACPTLLEAGRQDACSPLARHQDMARQISQAQLAIFEDCGHMTPVEAPAAVNDALRDWLQAACRCLAIPLSPSSRRIAVIYPFVTEIRLVERVRSSVRCGSVLPRALSRRQPALIIAALLAAASPAAWAQSVPETAAVPQGINLGGTSFLDGFSSMKPGWTVIEYLRHAGFDAIKNANGDNSPAFRDPKIGTSVVLTQLIYVTPYTWKGGALSFNAIVPLVNYDTFFAADSPVRVSSNGFGMGDISFGPALQMPPVMRVGWVFFFQRFAIDAFAPVGKFDRDIAINQSTGFWSVAPQWAFTMQPTDSWEISGRVNYLYNFRSNRAGGVPPIRGFQFRNGKAGDALWANFASSVKVTEQLRVGINGFYLQQLKDNRTNGERVPDSKRRQFYAGPGMSWGFNEKNLLNFMSISPSMSKTRWRATLTT